MKNLKYLLVWLLTAAMLLSLCACGGGKPENNTDSTEVTSPTAAPETEPPTQPEPENNRLVGKYFLYSVTVDGETMDYAMLQLLEMTGAYLQINENGTAIMEFDDEETEELTYDADQMTMTDGIDTLSFKLENQIITITDEEDGSVMQFALEGSDWLKPSAPAGPTDAPTDAPTDGPTDAPTEAPTDAPTEAPTDAPTEAPTEPAPAVDPSELVGEYSCIGYSTESADAYGEAPLGCCLYLFDDGTGFLVCDEFTDWELQWQINGTAFTAAVATGENAWLNGTWNNGVLELVYDKDSYYMFQMKTEDQLAQEALSNMHSLLSECEYYYAIAYMGWCDDGSDLQSWIGENSPELLEYEPYIKGIPQERMIGTSGELYCIVPADPNATVTVNLMQNTDDGEEVVREVLYQAENGEPILLLCNSGDFYPDTQVIITNSDDQSIDWYPQTGEYGTTGVPRNDDLEDLALDISNYDEVYPYGYNGWLSDGWLETTADFLASTCWSYYYTEWLEDTPIEYCWTLNLDIDGTAQFNKSAEGSLDYAETYTGTWSVGYGEDMMSYLTLDMTQVGGTEYQEDETPAYIGGRYVVLENVGYILIGTCSEYQELFVPTDGEYTSFWMGAVG